MKFVVSLIHLLCAIVTAGILAAFAYYTIVYQKTGYAGSLTASHIALVLAVIALLIWGLLSVAFDAFRGKGGDAKALASEIMSRIKQLPSGGSTSANTDKITATILSQLRTFNDDNRVELDARLEAFEAKLSAPSAAGATGTAATDIEVVRQDIAAFKQQTIEALTLLSENVTKLSQNQLKLFENLSNLTAVQAMPKNKPLSEISEAEYPESVMQIDNEPNETDITAETETTDPISDILAEIPAEDEIIAAEDILADENATNKTVEDILTEDENTPLSPFEAASEEDAAPAQIEEESAEVIAENNNLVEVEIGTDDQFGASVEAEPVAEENIVAEPEKLDLGASNPFGAPVEAEPVEENVVAEPEKLDLGASNPFGAPVEAEPVEENVVAEPAKLDLGADDPFGAPVAAGPTAEENVVAEPAKIDLGADDPFGAPAEVETAAVENVVAEPAKIDLGADNPFGTNDASTEKEVLDSDKLEPQLDSIFNDKLASELADLEIMQENPQAEKNPDDIDINRFFDNYRKNLK